MLDRTRELCLKSGLYMSDKCPQMFGAPNEMLDGSNVGSRETNGVINLLQIGTEIISHLASKYSLNSVSYTHLTLPTNREV